MFLNVEISNKFIKFLGIGFGILGIIRMTPIYDIDSRLMLAVSLTAIFLLLSDFVQLKVKNYLNSNDKGTGKEENIFIKIVHNSLIALSAFSIIAIPRIR